jgi:hypothetical protein
MAALSPLSSILRFSADSKVLCPAAERCMQTEEMDLPSSRDSLSNFCIQRSAFSVRL